MKAGFSAVIARFETMGARIAQALEPELWRAASRCAARARRAAPVERGVLRASIRAVREAPLEAAVRADAPYAGCVELGTIRMPPEPYLAPSARAERADFAAACARAARRTAEGGGK